VGLGILLNALGYMANRVAPLSVYYERAEQDYINLIQHKDNIQAISLGNSHSEAIDFAVLDVEGQTLARAGADLFEVERYTAAIVDSLPTLRTVFITLSYYSFSRDNATLDNMKILRIELYTMLPIWRPIAKDGGNVVLGKLHEISRLMNVARPDHWHDIIYSETGFNTLFDDVPEFDVASAEAHQEHCPHLTLNELESHAQEVAGKNVISSREMANLHQGLEEDAFEALAETIERLQRKGIKVILYTPPYYEAYTAHFTDQGSDIIEHMQQAVKRLQEKYQIDYYDFSTDRDLITRSDLFVNSDHVNDCGRKAFSERLLRAMVKTTLIGRNE
jgi:hypothetical protein